MIRFRPGGRFCLVALFAASAFTGCGSDSAPPTSPGGAANPFTITISTGGIVAPKPLTVPPGTRVLFVNNDTRRHDVTSDPHPDHLDCPELNQVGVLNPGQNRESGNLVTVRTCGFHDHDNPDNVNLRGSIIVR
jgi:plastocyanin